MKVADKDFADERKLASATARLNAKVLGLSLGILFGLTVFIATNWLLIKGGHVTPSGHYAVGPHLQLLDQFFIGYRVSFIGSIIGFLYGFACGALTGAAIGWIYNRVVLLKGL